VLRPSRKVSTHGWQTPRNMKEPGRFPSRDWLL
jgi:hypothetical protein